MTEPAAHEAAHPNGERHKRHELGFAGRVARAFVESPLTPLLLMAFFLIGLLGMAITPREEDPQISVPMVDIFVAYPGAAASEVANLVSEPLERLMSELPGVKHVYSMSRDGLSMVTVRFEVGERMEPSLVKLYNKLYSNMDLIPKGVMQPLVKPKSIDDVPVVTVTLSSSKLDLVQLRKLGLDALQRFKALPNTGQSFVTGGSREQVRIDVDLPRMSSHKVTLSQIAQAVAAANQRIPGGYVVDGGKWFNIYTGDFLATVADVENLVIAVDDNRPVFLRDVAKVTHGESETKSVVDNNVRDAEGGFAAAPAVTVAVAKKYGSNGIVVANELIRELEAMKGRLIPDSVTVTVTRDYGETAQDKVTHLIMKLFIVSALVTILALLTMGTRPAMIVMITIPATLLMSISVAYVLGFTINRVSMFALVFAIGILVDDAIVVVENIYRRWLEFGTHQRPDHGRGGGRGRQSDHSGDLHRGGGAAADGLRQRHDGPLHAAHPGAVVGGDDLFAVCGLRLRAVAGGAGEAEHVGAQERGRARAPPGGGDRALVRFGDHADHGQPGGGLPHFVHDLRRHARRRLDVHVQGGGVQDAAL